MAQKAVIVIGDGMSDKPLDRLDGKTPLMVARKPAMDRIAREGRCGLLRTVREEGPADSAVANLAVLGYDPLKYSQGRAVLEAASMGIHLEPDAVALRCNLIALDPSGGSAKIKNHSAGHIPTEEASQIIRDLDEQLGGGRGPMPVSFHPGISYRHLLILHGGWASPSVWCAPPHDHVGSPVEDLMPRPLEGLGSGERAKAAATAARLANLYKEALPILQAHPVNKRRAAEGKDEASAIWPWSPGRKPAMPTLRERFGISAAVISAVDLIMGLGVYAGMDVIRVPGATGLHDTNYEGKADAALEALQRHDLVYVHVEASDEASHAMDLDLKIRCIEYLDQRLIQRILDGLESKGIDATIAVLPDHPTPVETGKHGRDPVPVAILKPGLPPDAVERYDEESVKAGSLGLMEGDAFIRTVLEDLTA